MDEARLAVQQIVLARQQPSELLPRAPPIIALQVCCVIPHACILLCARACALRADQGPTVTTLQIKMLQEFNLQHEVIGHGLNSRLRILPALNARLSVN